MVQLLFPLLCVHVHECLLNEKKHNFISALFLLHRVVWAGWSMLMLAYNAHCMLIQCSQKVFIKFASRRYDDTPSPPPSDADVHLRF